MDQFPDVSFYAEYCFRDELSQTAFLLNKKTLVIFIFAGFHLEMRRPLCGHATLRLHILFGRKIKHLGL